VKNIFDRTYTFEKQNACFSNKSKRFLSFSIDLVLIIIFAFLFSLGGYQLVRNSDSFITLNNEEKEEIKYYNSMINDTHLVSFVDEDLTVRKDEDIMIIENISKHIYLSYLKMKENNVNEYLDFVINENDSLASYKEASFTNDSISYFYTEYIVNNNLNIIDYSYVTPKAYVKQIYKSNFPSSMYKESDEDEFPIMYYSVSYSLYVFLTKERNDINKTYYDNGKEYNSSFYDAYSNLLNAGESLMIKSEPYYSTHYLNYRKIVEEEYRLFNIALILSIMLSYLIINLIPKFIFGYHQTIGRKAFSLFYDFNKNHTKSLLFLIVETILGLFGFLLSSIILYLFPPFSGVYDGMIYNFIGLPLYWILLIIAIFIIVNYFTCLVNQEHKTLVEILFKTTLKDEKKQN